MQTNLVEKNTIERLFELQSPCVLCPRECGAKRNEGEIGFCGATTDVVISSHGQHLGEEPPISGISGSGTVFFSHCTLSCKFCQNFPISQLHNGYKVTIDELADIFLLQQTKGFHNVNLVTPTHFAPQIVVALDIAKKKGLTIPVVYNTSGYESVEVIKLLNGYVDIYLPDMKYFDDSVAQKISSAINYVDNNKDASIEMGNQVGELELDEYGIAKKGLIIRHLVLPENKSNSDLVLKWIAEKISYARISLMSQYFPAHKAVNYPGLDRKITKEEYDFAVKIMEEGGLNGWIQPIQ